MMLFEQIYENSLVKGIRYKLKDKTKFYARTFIGIYNGTEIDQYGIVLLWINIKYHLEILDKPYCYHTCYFENIKMNIHNMYERYIYKLVPLKGKIQETMEQRAINLILQNIIGDTSFTYDLKLNLI